LAYNWGRILAAWIKGLLKDPAQYIVARELRSCTICGFSGRFMSAPGRRERRCPHCGSRERDRIIGLYLYRSNVQIESLKVLHFAPEGAFYRRWRNYPRYVAADLVPTRTSDHRVDITAINRTDQDVDLVICNHVLEHVPDDGGAMAELFRVLKPGGVAIVSVPIARDRPHTWIPPAGMPRAEVDAICGLGHLRLYGLDFEDHLRAVGFEVERIAFSTAENETHGLADEIVHICRKPAIM
jgi:SAM-dependent methyltransferase